MADKDHTFIFILPPPSLKTELAHIVNSHCDHITRPNTFDLRWYGSRALLDFATLRYTSYSISHFDVEPRAVMKLYTEMSHYRKKSNVFSYYELDIIWTIIHIFFMHICMIF